MALSSYVAHYRTALEPLNHSATRRLTPPPRSRAPSPTARTADAAVPEPSSRTVSGPGLRKGEREQRRLCALQTLDPFPITLDFCKYMGGLPRASERWGRLLRCSHCIPSPPIVPKNYPCYIYIYIYDAGGAQRHELSSDSKYAFLVKSTAVCPKSRSSFRGYRTNVRLPATFRRRCRRGRFAINLSRACQMAESRDNRPADSSPTS